MRLSGCPSLSLKKLDDPLRDDPVASIDQSCVGCGNCGEVADAAILCPSFYRADVVHNPSKWEQRRASLPRPRHRLAAIAPRRAPPDLRGGRMTIHDLPARAPDARLDGVIKLAVLAVGGQGGGVLTGWIEDLARQNGYAAQATSVAGVSQRTGATIYYVEMARRRTARPSSR